MPMQASFHAECRLWSTDRVFMRPLYGCISDLLSVSLLPVHLFRAYKSRWEGGIVSSRASKKNQRSQAQTSDKTVTRANLFTLTRTVRRCP